MLYFQIEGKTIETLDIKDIKWLVKMEVIKKGRTGLLEDGVETLPFFDDYEISYKKIICMQSFSKKVIIKLKKTSEFRSKSLDKFCKIIDTCICKKKPVSVTCD